MPTPTCWCGRTRMVPSVKRLASWQATTVDLNGDGAADLVLGEPSYEIRNSSGTLLDAQERGTVYIFFSAADAYRAHPG